MPLLKKILTISILFMICFKSPASYAESSIISRDISIQDSLNMEQFATKKNTKTNTSTIDDSPSIDSSGLQIIKKNKETYSFNKDKIATIIFVFLAVMVSTAAGWFIGAIASELK